LSTNSSTNQNPDIDKSFEFIDNEAMALIGYARVSTTDQHLHLQQDALKSAGCLKIFTDTISGATTERKGLDEALDYVRSGDTLVVWRLDRLGRSLKHLIETVTMLQEKGIGFKSLTEQIDTGTSGGKLIFHIFGALAEFERNLIRERTNAGLTAARARGKRGGRPKSPLSSEMKLQMAKKMYADKTIPVEDIYKGLGIPRSTFYKYLKARDADLIPIRNGKVASISLAEK
jgi:DNA invertase Pin-like site-specific DNA recombinase